MVYFNNESPNNILVHTILYNFIFFKMITNATCYMIMQYMSNTIHEMNNISYKFIQCICNLYKEMLIGVFITFIVTIKKIVSASLRCHWAV